MSGNWEVIRLSLGAFLTSPGAGILGVIPAAYLALVGVRRRLAGDRQLAKDARDAEAQKDRDSDARARWQKFHDHLWENRAILPAEAMILGVQSLGQLVETQEQSAMLEVFAAYLQSTADEEGGDEW